MLPKRGQLKKEKKPLNFAQAVKKPGGQHRQAAFAATTSSKANNDFGDFSRDSSPIPGSGFVNR